MIRWRWCWTLEYTNSTAHVYERTMKKRKKNPVVGSLSYGVPMSAATTPRSVRSTSVLTVVDAFHGCVGLLNRTTLCMVMLNVVGLDEAYLIGRS